MSTEIRNAPDASDKKAMELIFGWPSPKTDKFPSDLEKYFKNNKFKVVVSAGNELQQDFEAQFVQKIKLQKCGPIQAGEKNKGRARVVPMVEPAGTGAPFQAGLFATIDLAVPGLVISPQLTGCCLVLGFEKEDSTKIYMGHAKVKAGQNRKELVEKMKKVKPEDMFEGKSNVKKIELFGGEKEGYGDGTADILGWVSGDKFFLAAKIEHPSDKPDEFKVVKYPSRDIMGTMKSVFGGSKSKP